MGAARKSGWQTFLHDNERWSIVGYKLGYDIGFEAPGIKRYEFHTYVTPREANAAYEPRQRAGALTTFVFGRLGDTPP